MDGMNNLKQVQHVKLINDVNGNNTSYDYCSRQRYIQYLQAGY